MKKLILLLTVVGTMWFTACGGGSSSKEAKELLQRILNLVGIPQSIVINVCQDNNDNNFCESSEILAKITIDKDDTVDMIWQKIFDNENNSYWLEEIDPDKKLLLVMQDMDNVQDDGKFTLPFTVDISKEQNSTKELSILESMVDANYLNPNEVVAVKSMDSVDKFYDVLLKDLMKNFNTLKNKNLDSSQSILANLEYMANDLREKGIAKTLPDRVNACKADVVCIDAIIAEVFKDLEITDAEADEIAGREKKVKEPTETISSSRTMFLSKETSYDEDGNVDNTDTYQYDSNNRMISSKGTGEYNDDSCTFSYDSQSRLTESSCNDTYDGKTTTDKTIYHYDGDKLTEHTYYFDGILESRYNVVEWSGNKPIKVEWTDDRGEDDILSTWSSTISYTGDNPTHVEHFYNHEHSWQTDRVFDNKKTPYDLDSIFGGGYYAWGMGKNNILKEESTSTYVYEGGTYSSKTVTKNEITYNSNNLPTRIDTYITLTYSHGETAPAIHTYTTYEYK